jgi:hypothetical protein
MAMSRKVEILMIFEDIIIGFPDFWFQDSMTRYLLMLVQVWILSLVISWIYRLILEKKYKFKTILTILFIPGVILHEISHIIACVLCGVKIRQFQLYDAQNISGWVNTNSLKSPMIAFFVCFAPLIIGVPLIFFIDEFVSGLQISSYVTVLFSYLKISAMCMAGPSYKDNLNFFTTAGKKLSRLFFDIGFLILAFLIYNIIGNTYHLLQFFHPILHFIFIFLIYFILYIAMLIMLKVYKHEKSIYIKKTNYRTGKPSKIEVPKPNKLTFLNPAKKIEQMVVKDTKRKQIIHRDPDFSMNKVDEGYLKTIVDKNF